MILVTLLSRLTVLTEASSPTLRRRRNTTPTSLMFTSLSILNKNLTILAVTSWCILRNLDDGEPSLKTTSGVSEDCVHFFEGSICSLGIEEVDNREYEGVDDSEDDVCLVADGRKRNGSNHDDHEVPDPIS